MLTQIPNTVSDLENKKKDSFLRSSLFVLRTSFGNSPLFRQLMGAIGGAVIAVLIYQGYALVSPYVMSMFGPGESAMQKQILEETRSARLDRIGAVAAEELKSMQASAPEQQ